MKAGIDALRATLATLLVAGGIGMFAPALAADGADTVRGYVTDGFDRPISDGAENCVGDGSAQEGTTRKCGAATTPAPVAEPKKEASSAGA